VVLVKAPFSSRLRPAESPDQKWARTKEEPLLRRMAPMKSLPRTVHAGEGGELVPRQVRPARAGFRSTKLPSRSVYRERMKSSGKPSAEVSLFTFP